MTTPTPTTRAEDSDLVTATFIALHEALAAERALRVAAEARVAVLEGTLVSARETILQLFNARWSEAEGSAADWTAEIDVALESGK